jgi:hypothetical protein
MLFIATAVKIPPRLFGLLLFVGPLLKKPVGIVSEKTKKIHL